MRGVNWWFHQEFCAFNLHEDLHSRCWKSWPTQLLFLTLFRGENGPRYSSTVLSCSPVSESCSVWCTCCLLAIFFGGGFALRHSDCKWPVKWQLKHSESLYLHLSGVWMVAQFAEIVFHARRDVDPPSDRITTCCRAWPVWTTASSAASWKVKLPDNNSPTNFTILYPGFWFAEWNRYLCATFKRMDL